MAPSPEDLIRVLSYPRKDHDLAVLHFEDSPPLADIRSHTSDLGTLGRLPLELLIEILRHLDLKSFLQYRRVNSHAWRSVNTIPEYRLTATHAINVLRAICGLGVARHFSILQVFNALVSRGCDLCRDSGAFLLFIPTCTRHDGPILGRSRRTRRARSLSFRHPDLGSGGSGLTYISWRLHNKSESLRGTSLCRIAVSGQTST